MATSGDAEQNGLLVTEAQRLLAAAWEHPVRIREQAVIRDWGRHRLLRCRVKEAPADAPDFVVVKAASEPGRTMRRERAGLALLAGITPLRGLVPEVYAADESRTMVVIEDLGDGPTLGQLLRARAAWAEWALLESMRGLAAVHAGTRGLAQRYAQLCDWPGGTPDGDPAGLPLAEPELSRILATALAQAGMDTEAVPSEELAEVATRMTPAADLRCLTFHDQCPSNRVMADERLRLIDLEFAGFRHPFLDGSFAMIGHLNCMDGLRLPEAVQRRMLDTYRAGVMEAFPELVEERRFGRELACASAVSVIAQLRQLPAALEHDRVVGHFLIRRRQRLLAVLAAFITTTGPVGALPRLVRICRQLRERLADRWEATVRPLPLFPVFERGTGRSS